jgi:hypothetical protein
LSARAGPPDPNWLGCAADEPMLPPSSLGDLSAPLTLRAGLPSAWLSHASPHSHAAQCQREDGERCRGTCQEARYADPSRDGQPRGAFKLDALGACSQASTTTRLVVHPNGSSAAWHITALGNGTSLEWSPNKDESNALESAQRLGNWANTNISATRAGTETVSPVGTLASL